MTLLPNHLYSDCCSDGFCAPIQEGMIPDKDAKCFLPGIRKCMGCDVLFARG